MRIERIKHQLCSLELSKRLKELGVKQESYFCWWQADNLENYSAFTASELGEILPKGTVLTNGNKTFWEICINIPIAENRLHFNKFVSDKIKTVNEADARATMIIYLLENNLMELPK